jgi:predicted nuclease of predicted toxin-antitoxin system
MKILIDECLPRALKRHLRDRDCRTVQEMGWSGKKNGELLSVAAGEGFEVLVTIDQGMEHQQNLTARNIALLVIEAASNQIEDLLPIMPAARAALGRIQPGTVVRVSAR